MNFILRRAIKIVEQKEVKAKDWPDALKRMKTFEAAPVSKDGILLLELSTIEYIGDK